MTRVVVTGGSGKAGRAVVHDLLEHGYDVRNVDRVLDPNLPDDRQVVADLTDYAAAADALEGADAVVHLAAIPAPGLKPDDVTYRINVTSTYNVFAAAPLLGLRRVVWASSETTVGVPFDSNQPPWYAPVDEEHYPRAASGYAMSKVVGEETAKLFSRLHGIPYVALRFSNVMEPGDYERFPTYWADPQVRCWNLWGYVDARDAAQSCRLALEAELDGAEAFLIAAADTVMTRTNSELMAEVFPGVELRRDLGEHDTLVSIGKARRLLGYEPQFSWRRFVD